MEAIQLIKRNDGVAILRFDTPDSPVNILSSRFFADFGRHLDTIARDADIRACVLSSAKPDSFIAGADLDEVLAMTLPTQAAAFSREGHALLDRIAQSSKPFVAAIHGPALGGGLEVALACHYRLASDDPRTVLALPEVQLGLLPAGGGTQRLIPLVGIERGLPMLLTGQRIRAAKAYKMGLVDALTSPFGIEETAAKAALMLADGKLSARHRKVTLKEKLLQGPLRGMVLKQAREGVIAKTRGLYPAPLAILDCVRIGLSQGIQKGLAQEELGFGALVTSPEAKNLIGLFHATTAKKKLPDGMTPRPVKRIGVLGAGLMGEGIASVSISSVPVVLKDVADETLSKAARNLHGSLAKRVKSGSLASSAGGYSSERDTLWHRLRFTTEASDLAGCDLIVEAVFEDLELKRKVLAETEAVLAPEAVYATNTSALPIASIAAAARHPERVLGMHYFSPVPKMPLLEVVVTPQTADWAIATAMATGKAQGKTVIVVKDGPGFYTTRILAPFLNEAAALLSEGASVETIDRALKDFGFPVGPITLIDEVGLDVAAHVSKDLGKAFAHRGIVASEAMLRMVEAGYKGRKNGKGFYCYEQQGGSSKSKLVNPDAYAFFRTSGANSTGAPSTPDIVDRLVLMMVNEAAYCLEEGILRDATDGDLGAVMGLGFPPIHGGPFRYADALGIERLVARLSELAQAHGSRFTPAPLLVEMACVQRRFHVIPAQAGIQDAGRSA